MRCYSWRVLKKRKLHQIKNPPTNYTKQSQADKAKELAFYFFVNVFSKNAWVIPLKYKENEAITKTFQKIAKIRTPRFTTIN